MDYSARKLGREAIADLEQVPGKDLVAWRPVFLPLYLFLRRNQKFLRFRAPFDYLTDEDLRKAEAGGPFFRPKLDAAYAAFDSSGRRLRVILEHRLLLERPAPVQSREQRESLITSARLPETGLPPPPYQLSSDVLNVIGPLWGRKLEVSPALVCLLVESLCDPLEPEALIRAHEADVVAYVDALRISSWSVFLALHLGMCDLPFLNRLRRSAFEEVASSGSVTRTARSSEERELISHARALVSGEAGLSVGMAEASTGADRVVRKLERRLKRVADRHAIHSELAGGAWHV